MAETTAFKEKRKLYARLLKNYSAWVSLVESKGESYATITFHDGQEIHYLDILEGFKVLPPRQRQAVWLMCVQDRPEAEVAKIMGFKNKINPSQQYKNLGLFRLIQYQEASPEDKAAMLLKAKRYQKGAYG